MTDAGAYLGIPYADYGDSRDGASCWGLVRLALREMHGRDIPARPWDGDSGQSFRAVPEHEADAGDVVLLETGGGEGEDDTRTHVGMFVDKWRVLHMTGAGSAIERVAHPLFAHRVKRVYKVREARKEAST